MKYARHNTLPCPLRRWSAIPPYSTLKSIIKMPPSRDCLKNHNRELQRAENFNLFKQAQPLSAGRAYSTGAAQA